ncbi:MAG TPA: S8 family serine peptidase, partial [Acidimicrobiia bacterium]|nr:S8 family serine peptidase [Acidimicrobiia bacterium]
MLVALLFAATPLSAEVPDGIKPVPRNIERVSGNVSGDFTARSPDDIVEVFIQFDQAPVARVAAQGANSSDQKAQGQRVLAQQRQLRSALSDYIVREMSAFQVAANGIKAKVRAGDIPAIRAVDGVVSVAAVTYYYLDNADSVPFIGGDVVKGEGIDGEGVTIAIIDTGIDYTHAAFGGDGDPEDYENNQTGIIEPGTFPTDKVIGGFDFAGPNYDPCADVPIDVPSPDPDPLDVHGHGTHVAATAAGYETDGHGAGMAPGAKLYAFKVFGDITGCTNLTAEAIERALDPNNDLDTSDHVDVINMSLGSAFGSPDDVSAIATQSAVDLGVVVVASAGNEGPISYITGAPAVADGAISVAAIIDEGYELNAVRVNSPAELARDYEAAIGDFGDLDDPVTGDLVVAEPLDACADADNGLIENAEEMEGKIAFIQRGTCSFSAKVRAARDADAIGVLVFNNAAGDPIVMGQDGNPDQPTDTPAMMISLEDGELILGAIVEDEEVVNVTLSDDVTIPKPELAAQMADFSSQGPGHGNGFKPDVSAPGFGIVSADVGTGSGGASSNGTSMAAPHIAGLAAQVLEAYPDLDPAAVKALIMNSATPAEPSDVPLARQGTGIAQADRAVLDLRAYAAPAGLSFGRLNPLTVGSATETVTVTMLENGDDATYEVDVIAHSPLPGVSLTVSDDTITTSGGVAEFDVTLSWNPAQMDADEWGATQTEFDAWIEISNDSDPDDSMVVGVLAVIDPASSFDVEGGEGEVTLGNDGPAAGFAVGYNLAGVGDGDNFLQAVGYTAYDVGFDILEVGLATMPIETPNPYEIDLYVDVDGDADPDWLLAAIDLGLIQTGSFSGDYVTVHAGLKGQGLSAFALVDSDFNDEVMSLYFDLSLLAPEVDELTVDVVAWYGDTFAGSLEGLTFDLGNLIETEVGNYLEIPGGAGGTLEVDGSGEMLWLFPNDPVGSQYTTTTIEAVVEPEPEPGPDFDDVPEGHLFAAEISWLAAEGITRGCNPPANTMFCPDGEVTRGQMAAFLVRALGLPGSSTDHFDDDNGHLFEAEINAIAEAGITRGCNPPANTNFCPNSTLSRAEMATFMQRAFNLGASSTDWFVDDDGNIHESAINAIADADITRGCNPPTND